MVAHFTTIIIKKKRFRIVKTDYVFVVHSTV